jgi:glycosyltransferase involved in cell wall biosynthesis
MIRPEVSVIIPAYNSSKYIEETLVSVLNQTYRNFEVIVIDDGSTDGQTELILKWIKKDSRFRCVYQSNQGVSASRNVGFNQSVGNYIAFLDADDVWMPGNLESKIKKFEEGNFGLVHSDGYLINENSDVTIGKIVGREGMLLNDMLEWTSTQVPGPSSILVTREVLNTVGLFDANLSTSADVDFFLRVSARYNIGRVDQVTWKYRLHSGNMHKHLSLMEKDVLFVYKKASVKGLFYSHWFERKCYASMYLILAASWAGDGKNKWRAIVFTMLALFKHPNVMVNLFNRLSKKWL